MKLNELGFGWDLVSSPYELTSTCAGSSQTTRFKRKPRFHSLKRYRPKLGTESIEKTDQQGRGAPLSSSKPSVPLASTGNQSRRRVAEERADFLGELAHEIEQLYHKDPIDGSIGS